MKAMEEINASQGDKTSAAMNINFCTGLPEAVHWQVPTTSLGQATAARCARAGLDAVVW